MAGAGDYDTICSECGASLAGKRKGAKTCSQKCRKARSARRAAAKAPTDSDLAQKILRREVPDIAHDAIKEEIRPVIREALTKDVLDSIRSLVALTPKMIAAIERDLDSEDETIRQKAYTLLARYTIGHERLVPDKPDEDKKIVVQFAGMPRPSNNGSSFKDDNYALPAPGTIDGPKVQPYEELLERVCASCGVTKSADQFVGTSDRCYACHQGLADRAERILNPPDENLHDSTETPRFAPAPAESAQ